jgi:hypothetical protein
MAPRLRRGFVGDGLQRDGLLSHYLTTSLSPCALSGRGLSEWIQPEQEDVGRLERAQIRDYQFTASNSQQQMDQALPDREIGGPGEAVKRTDSAMRCGGICGQREAGSRAGCGSRCRSGSCPASRPIPGTRGRVRGVTDC